MPLNKGTGKDKGFRALRSDSQGDGKRTLPRKGKGKGNGKEQAGRSRLGEGFVKKSLFNKERRTIPAWRNAGKEGTKGKGKGSSKGARRALKGKGQGKWSDVQSGYQSGGPKLWKGARSSKGKSKGKGKQWQKQRPAQSEEQRQRPSLSSRKGKGKGKRNGQGQFRAPDVMRVRRDGGIQKRQGKGGTGETYLGSTAIARALRQSKVEGSKFVEVGEDWCLRPDGGSFAWVRKANKRTDRPPNSRELRTEVASQTLVACHEQGYNLEGKSVPLNYIEKMKAGTHFVCADESRAVLVAAGKRNFTTSWKRAACGKSADLAIDRARAGLKVALVNAASAYHMGGGFMTGGRHALEESLCMQSTLFQSLEVAGRKAEQEHIGPPPCVGPKRLQDGTEESWHCHVPVKGAILSPSVEFFRAGTNEGYTFQSEATEVCAIVSVAMPNCNPDMRDCPVDAPKDMDEYKGLLVDKCHALCAAALKSGATVLVVPDVGCGVYGNHATDVGAALGGVLGGAFKGVFQEVLLAGTSEFQRAVEMAAATWSLGPELPDISSSAVRKAFVENDLVKLRECLHPSVMEWNLNAGPYAPKSENTPASRPLGEFVFQRKKTAPITHVRSIPTDSRDAHVFFWNMAVTNGDLVRLLDIDDSARFGYIEFDKGEGWVKLEYLHCVGESTQAVHRREDDAGGTPLRTEPVEAHRWVKGAEALHNGDVATLLRPDNRSQWSFFLVRFKGHDGWLKLRNMSFGVSGFVGVKRNPRAIKVLKINGDEVRRGGGKGKGKVKGKFGKKGKGK